ncbi:MAG: response regulator, partial [Gemmatimonadales bacterium]
SGLGLAVVHGIMEEHGGAVRVDSEVGRGTEVQLFFPAGRRRPRPDRHAAGQHVLFVDDEAAIVKVGQQMLERLGFRVTAAETASDALAAFAAAPTSFDLVVSDLTMPDRSGLDLATAIHELNPGVRFVLTTGHPDAIDRSAPPGVAAVLAKPFGSEALAAVISRVLGPSAPR